MVVLITYPDSIISPASRRFGDFLQASLTLRDIEFNTLASLSNPNILNVQTSAAVNTLFQKELSGFKPTMHINIISHSSESSPDTDIIIAETPEVTDSNLNTTIANTIDDYTEVAIEEFAASSMFPSTYVKLILGSPTISLSLNEASGDYYRAVADSLAEVVEQIV